MPVLFFLDPELLDDEQMRDDLLRLMGESKLRWWPLVDQLVFLEDVAPDAKAARSKDGAAGGWRVPTQLVVGCYRPTDAQARDARVARTIPRASTQLPRRGRGRRRGGAGRTSGGRSRRGLR